MEFILNRHQGQELKPIIMNIGYFKQIHLFITGLPFKDCNTDGTWYRHPETQSPWTNYSPCSETDKVRVS